MGMGGHLTILLVHSLKLELLIIVIIVINILYISNYPVPIIQTAPIDPILDEIRLIFGGEPYILVKLHLKDV